MESPESVTSEICPDCGMEVIPLNFNPTALIESALRKKWPTVAINPPIGPADLGDWFIQFSVEVVKPGSLNYEIIDRRENARRNWEPSAYAYAMHEGSLKASAMDYKHVSWGRCWVCIVTDAKFSPKYLEQRRNEVGEAISSLGTCWDLTASQSRTTYIQTSQTTWGSMNFWAQDRYDLSCRDQRNVHAIIGILSPAPSPAPSPAAHAKHLGIILIIGILWGLAAAAMGGTNMEAIAITTGFCVVVWLVAKAWQSLETS